MGATRLRAVPAPRGRLRALPAPGGALNKGRRELDLTGRYRVPLGGVGRGVNWIALHHLAEATIRRFLLEVAANLEGGTSTAR